MDVHAKVMGVSLKTENARGTEDDHADKGPARRTARFALSMTTSQVLRGSFPGALRPPTDVVGPPHPWPKAEHRALASSFFCFEEPP